MSKDSQLDPKPVRRAKIKTRAETTKSSRGTDMSRGMTGKKR